MVNKSPKKHKIQILDDSKIDEQSLRGYLKDGWQMNLTQHLITCVWWALIFGGFA